MSRTIGKIVRTKDAMQVVGRLLLFETMPLVCNVVCMQDVGEAARRLHKNYKKMSIEQN